MFLNNAQVCLDCEKLFIGDQCPKCCGRHFFYLRKYYPPMIRFGGENGFVLLRVDPLQRIDPIQEELPFVQGYPAIPAYSANSDTLDRELAMVQAQEEYVRGADHRDSGEKWIESEVGTLDYSSGKLLAAICTLLKGGYWSNAGTLSNLEREMVKKTIERSRRESESGYVDTKEVHERKLNFE